MKIRSFCKFKLFLMTKENKENLRLRSLLDQRLVLFYKIINGLASVETEDILTPADSRTRKNHSFKFKHFQAWKLMLMSWNNRPFGIEKVDSVEALEGFKLKLKEHTLLDLLSRSETLA